MSAARRRVALGFVLAEFGNAMPEIKRSNPKAFETILSGLKALDGLQGRVGWFPSAKYEDGTPVAYVMALNEFGHGNTPPRPSGRQTVAENKSAWRDLTLSASRQTVQGKISAYDAVAKLTQKAENDWKETILKLQSPPLSPVTLELRAMKKRDPNLRITAATVGIAALRVSQPGYQTPDVSNKPLIDSGFAIATMSNVVEVA